MRSNAPSKIAVVQPNFNVYSETFIRNHIKGLGQWAEVHDLAGGWVPTHANGRPLAPKAVVFLEKAVGKLLGKPYLHAYIARRVKQYLRQSGIQFVLCEYGPAGAAMMPICLELGLPFGVHFFGLDLHGKKLIEQYGDLYREMFQKADLVVAISTLQRQIIESMGCPPEKIKHIVCGADLAYLVPEIPPQKPPVFIAVGRMVEKKSPLTTLKAFQQVAQRFPEARLHYIGGGPLEAACKQFTQEQGLSEKVAFLPPQTPEAIGKAYQNARCFVQHSVTAPDGDSEGTPVAILDAGLAGLPTVATRHAGIADTVVDGTTGFLVPEHDVDGMANAMMRLLEDPALAHRMGTAASAHVLKHFSVPVTIAQLWEAIQESYGKYINKNL